LPSAAVMSSPAKDLARLPDPEHLKAVWSQVSEKGHTPTSNSLKAIGDDLPAIPFTLQDVKSEDGGTPPPTGSGASSRTMSLQDVTRAFQQVSTPPVGQSSSSPGSGAQQQTRPSYGYSPSGGVPDTAPRPVYSPYPPQMMTSGSPAYAYVPQPMPSPGARAMSVNGQATYAQPMWIPMGSAPPTPGAGVRPLHSPYGTPMMAPPMMAYPTPGAPPAMYAASHAPAVHSPLAGASPQGRGRGMLPPSPMPPLAMPPMYAGNPVAIHPSMHAYPSPITPGQGPPMQFMPGPAPHGVSSPRAAPTAMSYGQPPPAPYARTPW
jgi:hypothetical protein